MRTTSSTVLKREASPIRITAKDRKCEGTGAAKTSKRSNRRAPPLALLNEHFGPTEWPVTISYYNPAAKEVFIAGAFNDWDPATTPFIRTEDGKWMLEITLKPGVYEYRLIVDGVWQEDPMSARFAANPFGGLNSVLVVKD